MYRLVSYLAYIILGGIFIYAGATKILHPGVFAQDVYQYQLLPGHFVNVTAIYLPWLEVLAGLGLILCGGRRDAPALMILALLVLFTVAMAFNVHRGLDISCGCFSSGPGAAKLGWQKVAVNGVMILAAVYAFFAALRERQDRPLI